MVGNSDESGWRRPPARRGISWSPPHPVDSFRTVGGGFWHRISLPYRRSLFCAPSAFENASRTPGSLFEHGTHIRYQRRPSPVPNANHPNTRHTQHTQPPSHPTTQSPQHTQHSGTECHKARNGKGIASSEFIKLPEKEAIAKAQPGMPPKSFLTETPGLTLSPTHKLQMSSLPQKCSGHHP